MIYPYDHNALKDPLYKILEATAVQRLGILTPVIGQERLDASRIIAEQVPAEDHRTVKRKFRKAWRKAAKRLVSKAGRSKRVEGVKRYVTVDLGLGAATPSRKQKAARKREVAMLVRTEALIARKTLTST